MIKADYRPPYQALAGMTHALRQAPRATQVYMQKVVFKFIRHEVRARLKKYPPKHRFAYGEFPWTSKRQQRAFFATDGFGRGIPTRRTGELSRRWKTVAVFDAFGGTITVENPLDSARFVQGKDQQGFHAITGWLTVDDFLKEIDGRVDVLMTTGWDLITTAVFQGRDPMEVV